MEELLSHFCDKEDTLWPLRNRVEDLVLDTEQIAIAYNGVGINLLRRISQDCREKNPRVILNVTVNPEFVSSHLPFILKTLKFKMVALSLDTEKCGSESLLPPSRWIQAALDLRKEKLLVSANILMTDEMYPVIDRIIEAIAPYCKQIHLLRPKFYEQKLGLSERRAKIFLIKNRWKKLIFIDQCFRFEFFNEPCTRGKDFVSINPDGSLSLCSFDIHRENKKKLKMCLYI